MLVNTNITPENHFLLGPWRYVTVKLFVPHDGRGHRVRCNLESTEPVAVSFTNPAGVKDILEGRMPSYIRSYAETTHHDFVVGPIWGGQWQLLIVNRGQRTADVAPPKFEDVF